MGGSSFTYLPYFCDQLSGKKQLTSREGVLRLGSGDGLSYGETSMAVGTAHICSRSLLKSKRTSKQKSQCQWFVDLLLVPFSSVGNSVL